ncbi:MAG: hypothetical protein IPP84_14710 [Propionivibrio sp.]|uniref:hypothetical protein n=1 Tax=Propionivibrio sp. TaxID=2212460 RepID=UPI0025F33956|nr:hypothetical protein [Propionivibrio sp.]MBL0209136.1 hypothetical protein [Propionivibrio sp.]
MCVRREGAGRNRASSARRARIVGGALNLIENTGSIVTADGVRGFAIVGGTGNESVSNRGTVTGSVTLGAGTNEFTNAVGGVFNAPARKPSIWEQAICSP